VYQPPSPLLPLCMEEKLRGTDPPLDERRLRTAKLEIRRHEAAAPEQITASFDVTADADAKPDIALEQTADGRWRVNVSIAGTRAALVERSPIEPVRVPSRKLTAGLSRMKPEELAPSIPIDRDDFAVQPRLPKGQRDLRAYRDDREIRPTTVFSPDGRWCTTTSTIRGGVSCA
jgi:hypothetical protein